MMDSSDGLARSLHQLPRPATAGSRSTPTGCRSTTASATWQTATTKRSSSRPPSARDFELVATLPEDALAAVRETADVSLSVIGVVCEAEDGPTMDGEPLADRGYTHG